MATLSAIEQYKAQQSKAAELRESVKTEALSRIDSAIADLKEVGFNYQVTPLGGKGGPGKTNPLRPCPKCGQLGHDLRHHRWEKKKKK